MKNVKKNNITSCIEDLCTYDILNDIIDLIGYECKIDKKIENNEKLSYKEYFFKTYCISPSFVVNRLMRCDKK